MSQGGREIVVVTGMGGAGRTTALHVLEDLGFYCIDNLPVPVLGQAVRACEEQGAQVRIGIGMDVRVRAFLDDAESELVRLKAGGGKVTVIFVDADDAVLVRRYSESRRPHPLSAESPDLDVPGLIHRERERLVPLRRIADRVVDTSRLNPHELRKLLIDFHGGGRDVRLATRILSFGFKYGLPVDADLVFDVRYLPNPHFVSELRPMTGLSPGVSTYVLDRAETQELLGALEGLMRLVMPRFAAEGRAVLTIAVGCTGGRHRSVAVAEALAQRLADVSEILVRHRDVDRVG